MNTNDLAQVTLKNHQLEIYNLPSVQLNLSLMSWMVSLVEVTFQLTGSG